MKWIPRTVDYLARNKYFGKLVEVIIMLKRCKIMVLFLVGN